MIALDTETTGLDLHHAARPFFVTVCTDEGETHFWEWDVDPMTRKVLAVAEDVEELLDVVQTCDGIVGQNLKFDVTALNALDPRFGEAWPWDRMEDTLSAGHVLSSGMPHDLTSMVMQYLAVDIKPFEERLKEATVEARRMIQQARLKIKRGKGGPEFGLWRIAEAGMEGMPSVKVEPKAKDAKGLSKSSPWGGDMWLPRTVAREADLRPNHPWWTVLSDYSNMDSMSTMSLWRVMKTELERQGLWAAYREKMRSHRPIWLMGQRGLTVNGVELSNLEDEYTKESKLAGAVCVNLAKGLDVDLTLPKNGRSKALNEFMFDTLKLPVLKMAKSGQSPSMDKAVMDEWFRILSPRSKGGVFVDKLLYKRKRDTALSYLSSYRKFWLPTEHDHYCRLHPSLNPTGTGTTRLSCSNPNGQQISKLESKCRRCDGEGCGECDDTGEDLHSLRRCFGPLPGREWYSLDAKNIELRIPAYESGEPQLIELFERPNDPPFYGSQHLLNMSVVYSDVWGEELRAVGIEKVGPHCKAKYASGPYQWTKNGGLAMQYQCSEATADRSFRRQGGYRKLKAWFKNLDALNAKWVAFARKHGYVETMVDRSINTTRGYPLECSRYASGEIKDTVPLNYRTQGTAGQWMSKAIVRSQEQLDEWRRQDGFDGHMILTVHDELLFDLPKDSPEWRIKTIKKLMEQGGSDIGVPTPVSCELHADNWAEGVEL